MNLYEYNTHFRLIDIEGVLLDPLDYIEIREPIGFRDSNITLEREEKAHGFLYEYSDAEKQFGFHRVKIEGQTYSAYELINSTYLIKGVDGLLRLQFLARQTVLDSFEVLYEGDLDLENISIFDYKIDVLTRRVTLSDLFRTRYETPISLIPSFGSIDDEFINAILPEEIFLHGKLIRQEVEGELIDKPTGTLGFNYASAVYSGTSYINPTFNKEIKSEITGYTIYNPYISFTDPIDVLSSVLGGEDFQSGKYSINGYIDYSLFLEKFGIFVFNNLSSFNVYFIAKIARYDGTTEEIELYHQTFGVYPDFPQTISKSYDFSFDEEFLLNKKDRLYLYIKYESSGTGTGSYVINFYFDETNIYINADLVEDSSTCKVYSPKDVFTRNIAAITNIDDAFESDFFDNEASQIYLTNGYNIRGFTTRYPEVNFKILFDDWAQPMFGLGYAIVENSGDYKIVMEKYENFYRDVEIDSFDTVVDESFIMTADSSLIFNEANVGYDDYPKSTDENKSNNLDEFNTEQTVVLPIKTVKKKAEYKSKIIGSGYKWENQRREQFKDKPSDTVSDDENLFVVKGVLSDTYNIPSKTSGITITRQSPNLLILNASYLNIIAGDIINISSSVPYVNGDYDVESISLLGDALILVTDVATGSGFTSYNIPYIVTLPESRLRVERNEAMQIINNVISPDTIYNAGLHPKNMLLNQSPIINSGCNPKPNDSRVVTQNAKLNSDAEFQFKVGEGSYVRGAGGLISMDGDLTLSDLNGNSKLFTGRLFKFTTKIGIDRVLEIRDACLGQHASKNWGYISVKDYNNEYKKGFITKMIYNPLSEEVQFECKEKYTPTGSRFDYVLDFPLA